MARWWRGGAYVLAGAAAVVIGVPASAPGGALALAGSGVRTAADSSAGHAVDAQAATGIVQPATISTTPARSTAAHATAGSSSFTPSTTRATASVLAPAAQTAAAASRTGGSKSLACNDGTVTYTPTTLWPPDHKMQTITISYVDADSDGDSTSIAVGAITDNQAASDGAGELVGSGQPTAQQGPDWGGTGNMGKGSDPGTPATTTAQVRAERSGTDPAGRTYDIKVTCMDVGGTPSEMDMQTVDLLVSVPHDQGAG
jgi:hypothetical protein